MISLIKKLLKKILPAKAIKLIQMIRNYRSYVYIEDLTYNQDGLATMHNCDFMNDPLFRESYKLGKGTGSWGGSDINWRAYIACWAANKARSLGGIL